MSFLSETLGPTPSVEPSFLSGIKTSTAPSPTQTPATPTPTVMASPKPVADFLGTQGVQRIETPEGFSKILPTAWNTLSSSITDAGNKLSDAVSTVQDHHASLLDKGVSVGEAGVSALNAIFSPITATLSGLQATPVIGHVADAVAGLFSTFGQGGSNIAKDAVDALPISQETKNKISPLAQEVGALAAQIITGKAGSDLLPSVADKSKTILDEVNKDVQKNLVPPTPTEAPAETPTPSFTPQVKGGFLEQTIKPTAPEVTPRVTPEQVSTPTEAKVEGQAIPETTPTTEAPAKPTKATTTLKPVEGTGELKVRTLAAGVEAKAIEQKLTDNFGDLPEYRTVNMKDQAERSASLIESDFEKAKSIAMGEKAPPKGLLPESVYTAVEAKATKEGDVATLRDLATRSQLTSAATTMGQRIRALGERSTDSAVRAIQDVQEARRAATRIPSDEKAQLMQQGRESIKKSAPTKQSWAEFVKSIQC